MPRLSTASSAPKSSSSPSSPSSSSSKNKSTNNWASKAVLGERIWLNRQQVPIPTHHNPVILLTNGVNAIVFLIGTWGLITLTVWPTLLGLSWVILGKTWFLDRMVWMFNEMAPNHLQYQQWLH